MQLENAVRKLTNLGLLVKVSNVGGYNQSVIARGFKQAIYITSQGGEVSTIRTIPPTDRDEIESDYFAGSFWESLAQAIRYAR